MYRRTQYTSPGVGHVRAYVMGREKESKTRKRNEERNTRAYRLLCRSAAAVPATLSVGGSQLQPAGRCDEESIILCYLRKKRKVPPNFVCLCNTSDGMMTKMFLMTILLFKPVRPWNWVVVFEKSFNKYHEVHYIRTNKINTVSHTLVFNTCKKQIIFLQV